MDVWERAKCFGWAGLGQRRKVTDGDHSAVTLAELGPTKQANEASKLAEIPEDLFEEILEDVVKRGGDKRAMLHEYRRRCQRPPQQGALALARAWKRATDEERTRFLEGLKEAEWI